MAEPLEEGTRRAFLTLLRTDKEVREEMGRLILESAVMQELRALREDTNRRFEELRADMDKRFIERGRLRGVAPLPLERAGPR
jgi:hypothetical protein